MDILKFCDRGIYTAEVGIACERLSGNIVKCEFWKGELSAYRAVQTEILNNKVAAPQSGVGPNGPSLLPTPRSQPDVSEKPAVVATASSTSQLAIAALRDLVAAIDGQANNHGMVSYGIIEASTRAKQVL